MTVQSTIGSGVLNRSSSFYVSSLAIPPELTNTHSSSYRKPPTHNTTHFPTSHSLSDFELLECK